MARSKPILYKITTIAMSVSILTICSWITIPFTIGITLQTYAVFLISGCFGLSISLSAISAYLLLGIMGIPVFSGFNAGISAFIGPSGGFLLGFLLSAIIISAFRRHYRNNSWCYLITMTASQIICYIMGCLWYAGVFFHGVSISLISVLSACVLPFLLTDAAKIILVSMTFKRISPYIQNFQFRSGGSL